MPGISQVDLAYSRLEFQCAHEVDVLPILNSSADILYRYGVYLEKLKGKKITARQHVITELLLLMSI